MASEVYLKQTKKHRKPRHSLEQKSTTHFLPAGARVGERHAELRAGCGLRSAPLGRELAQTPARAQEVPAGPFQTCLALHSPRGDKRHARHPVRAPGALGSPEESRRSCRTAGTAKRAKRRRSPGASLQAAGLPGSGPGPGLLTKHHGQNAARAIVTAGTGPLGKHAKTRL